jgi:hypothetical protein
MRQKTVVVSQDSSTVFLCFLMKKGKRYMSIDFAYTFEYNLKQIVEQISCYNEKSRKKRLVKAGELQNEF